MVKFRKAFIRKMNFMARLSLEEFFFIKKKTF